MAASCKNTNIWEWIHTLPQPSQWTKNTISTCICSSNSSLATLTLSITKNPSSQTISFSILANFNLPISLWKSKPVHLSKFSTYLLDETAIHNLILCVIRDVLKYGPSKQSHHLHFPKVDHNSDLKNIFNVIFLTLIFLICIYEAPIDLRMNCLYALTEELTSQQSRDASKLLMRMIGSNIEEQWLRCLNLAITNWRMELKAANRPIRGPSPLFCHGLSTSGLWKIKLCCPVITMEIENSSGSVDDKLMFSLNYHQLEAVIQLNYKVIIQDKWIDVMVNVDNIRLDVMRLVSENLLEQRGTGASEKHFPSRFSLQITPTPQTGIISVSMSQSSDNPKTNKEIEKNIEGSFEPPYSLGFKLGASETTLTSSRPWKFEESAVGDSGSLSWFLYDEGDGREVFASKPSPIELFMPKAWFKHRYSKVNRPFTRQGGVVFARDVYHETICWKVDKSALGKTMDWEISGCVGLTYWPNRRITFYQETRKAVFKETVKLTLA